MTDPREPPLLLYCVAVIPAGVAAYLFVSQWIPTSYAVVAACIAAATAAVGVFMTENLVEAVIVSAILIGAIVCLPKTFWIALLAFPAGLGFSAGKLAVGVWKEFRA